MKFTYFIQAVTGGPIKIGCTDDVLYRLKNLQTGNPCKLQVLLALPEEYASEEYLHKRFSHSRLIGEWFEPTDDLISLICELKPFGTQPKRLKAGASHPHPLRRWMASENITCDELAALVGHTGSQYMRFVSSGRRRPSWDMAKRISEATRGAVTAEELMDYSYERQSKGVVG